MKNILLAVTAIAAIALTGCGKNDDRSSLSGSRWTEFDGEATIELVFSSDIACRISITFSDSSYAIVSDYTYEYVHPSVKMYPRLSENAELRGMIDGKKMSVVNMSSGKTIYSLTRH